MTDKDRPTRKFSRGEIFEILTPEGKNHEPKLYGCVVCDLEDDDYKLCVFSYDEGTTEREIEEFGGLIDRTIDSTTYDPCPYLFAAEKAAKALKDGALRKFIEDAIWDRYDRWHEKLLPEVREILTEFSLAYWRREIYLREIDRKENEPDEPTGPTGEELNEDRPGPMATGGIL